MTIDDKDKKVVLDDEGGAEFEIEDLLEYVAPDSSVDDEGKPVEVIPATNLPDDEIEDDELATEGIGATEPDEKDLEEQIAEEGKAAEEQLAEQEAANRKAYGKRAQKRIQKLVKERNEAVTAANKFRSDLDDVQAAQAETAKTQAKNDKVALAEHEARLEAEEAQLKEQFLAANQQDDQDTIWKVNQRLATLQAEKLAIRQWKDTQPEDGKDIEERSEEEKAETVRRKPPQQRAKLHPQTQKWYNANKSWFGHDAEMTEFAREIHQELEEEGFEATEQVVIGSEFNNYFQEVNSRMRAEFPDRFKAKRAARNSPVGTSRGPTKKAGKVRLSPSEVETANNMGVTLQSYALEKEKLARRRGES